MVSRDGFAAYLVVADEEFGRQIPFAFLERVKEDFKRRYAGGKADSAIAHSLDKEFGYELCLLFALNFLVHVFLGVVIPSPRIKIL